MSRAPRASARAARPALVTAAIAATAALSACGDDVVERPAHRPISVVYVAGEPEGPWKARTEGLADGVKLAIAERDGLIGERAVSTVVVPIEQRDGDTVSAAIGGGRILRDSRAIAVLGTYTAPQLALAAPQLNGGELSLLQYGSGLRGLTEPEQPGEPGRYEPSGRRYALRGVPSDAFTAQSIRQRLPQFRGAQVVPITWAYDTTVAAEAQFRARQAESRRQKAIDEGDEPPLPSTNPALTAPSPEVPDAKRLAVTIAAEIGGTVVEPSGIVAGKPTILVTDPTEPNPSAAARSALIANRVSSTVPVLGIDAADRLIQPGALSRSGDEQFFIRRTIANANTAKAREIRAKEREQFGRDRGDAVVAGYFAAKRILELAANQPERTIDRVTYAKALTAAAPQDPNLPASAGGDATLGKVELLEQRGGRWVSR